MSTHEAAIWPCHLTNCARHHWKSRWMNIERDPWQSASLSPSLSVLCLPLSTLCLLSQHIHFQPIALRRLCNHYNNYGKYYNNPITFTMTFMFQIRKGGITIAPYSCLNYTCSAFDRKNPDESQGLMSH